MPSRVLVGMGVLFALAVAMLLLVVWRTHEPDAGYLTISQTGATISALSTAAIMASYRWSSDVRFRRHPNSLLYWKAVTDFCYALPYLLGYVRKTSATALVWIVIPHSLAYTSECWFFLMAYDLYASGTNPFTNTKQSMRFYHGLAWGVGTVAAVVQWYAIPAFNLHDVEDDDNSVIRIVYYLFVVACVASAAVLIVLEKLSQPLGGTTEALKTRRAMLVAARTYTTAYVVYQLAMICLWVLLAFVWPRTSEEGATTRYVTKLLTGARGFMDLVLWFSINRARPKPAHRSPARHSLSSASELDLELHPELNVALRREVLHFTTRGIVAASLHSAQIVAVEQYRVLIHLHELGMHIQFYDYKPRAFRDIRSGFGVNEAGYRASFLTTCHERIASGGSSGAFMFYTADYVFIVKTITKQERRVLLAMLPAYIKYMKEHPGSYLTRFYGCHAIQMYGQKFHFLVMGNAMGKVSMHQFFDLKGSWINRNAKPTPPGTTRICTYCNRPFIVGTNQTCEHSIHGVHQPHQVLRDNDFQRKMRLPADIVISVLGQLKNDSQFLAAQGIMDYSLLLSVHCARFNVDPSTVRLTPKTPQHHFAAVTTHAPTCFLTPSQAVARPSPFPVDDLNDEESNVLQSRGCRFSVYDDGDPNDDVETPLFRKSSVDFGTFDALQDELEEGSVSRSHYHDLPWAGQRTLEMGGYKACAVVGPDYYTFGIIDMLQTWTWQKRVERWWKVSVLQRDGNGISATPPAFYADRFQKKMESIMTVGHHAVGVL
ncbi:phosphatidylinositol 4-phosphate 5-kinase (PIPK-D3/GPCR-PIPK) [Achlya hypogyna]|uniref:Phosphatidylinositol 4-phosphate 5-kinase (PIPK-D3/GPCR-PIPK) n=1 Tax=Achlya hypogyna TaxID=1202772 RepID=A0A1V9Z953_ACHHY|nr:phosphatidylinositol 4-phosphate 5-kinase (PIPK-D3/GPCR-PIPK) [Achlya hypogyna]